MSLQAGPQTGAAIRFSLSKPARRPFNVPFPSKKPKVLSADAHK